MVFLIPIWIGRMQQDAEVAYSGAVGEQSVEGKCSSVTGAYFIVVVIGESRGGFVLVTARRVFVKVTELRDDGQGSSLAACKPLRDNTWVPWLHAHRGPYPRIGQKGRPPIPTDVGEMDDLFGVLFGSAIDGKIENPCQKLWRKLVRGSALVQKVRYTLRCGPQYIAQFLNLWWVCQRTELARGRTRTNDSCICQTIALTVYWKVSGQFTGTSRLTAG